VAQQIWLLRHGDAEAHGVRDDAERRLTEQGEAQARAAGAALAALGLEFSAVLTSPRVRAVETARLACEALGGEPAVHEPLTGGFERAEALELLAGHDADARLLLVGHEPDFSQLVHDLTGGRVDVKKGGVAGLRVGRGAGELLVLLRPRELERLAAG
jgi:phosphohistidine phosphatase